MDQEPGLFRTVFSRGSLSKCVPIALLVGTILSLVNQGSVVAGGDATIATWVRVFVNYLVPFCVSSAGYFSGQRAIWRSGADSSSHAAAGHSQTWEQPVLEWRQHR
jgi:hypothetical protein